MRRTLHPAHSAQGRPTRGTVKLLALACCIALAVVVTACSSTTPGEVVIKDLRFDPKDITVSTGTTVTWLNEDQTAHTVTSDSFDSTSAAPAMKFTSQPLNPGETYRHKFDQPGVYPYHCKIHPYLKGKVTVR